MEASFAHPVERELARLFDAHGIAWEYEPHTFVLEQDDDGRVREACTPDFFLPELGFYVECTVMRQNLTARKRRKVHKLRARTGEVVEILFRRDLHRLAKKWGLTDLAAAVGSEGQVSGHERTGTEASPMEGVFTREVGDFDVEVERPSTAASIVAVRGEADLHSAPELRDRLGAVIDAGAQRVLVDLTETTFIDSMALGVLLGSTKRLRANGGQLELIVSQPDIRRIFEITMLDRILAIHPSREAALALSGGDGPVSV